MAIRGRLLTRYFSGAQLALVISFTLILFASSKGLMSGLDYELFDHRFQLLKKPASSQVVLVEIDTKSIHKMGNWPWSGRVHASLVDRLRLAGARGIAFDIDVGRLTDKETNAVFAQSLLRINNPVIMTGFRGQPIFNGDQSKDQNNLPMLEFLQHTQLASGNLLADKDGIVRWIARGDFIGQTFVPSLPVGLVGNIAGGPALFAIDYSVDPSSIDRVSAADVLEGKIEQHQFANKFVIIAAGISELRDSFAVPLHGVMSGSVVRALATETLLMNRDLQTLVVPGRVVFALFFVLATLMVWKRVQWHVTLIASLCVIFATETAAIAAQLWYPVLVPTADVYLFGSILAASIFLREIDIRKWRIIASQNETNQTKAILGQVIKDNFDGVVVANSQGEAIHASLQAFNILGLSNDAEEKRHLVSRLPVQVQDDLAETFYRLQKNIRAPGHTRDIEYRSPDGGNKILEYVVAGSILDRSGKMEEYGHLFATLTFRDVTDKRATVKRLKYLANFDALTGLANRSYLESIIDDTIAATDEQERAFVVFSADLDRFKVVNDTLGYATGDKLLTAVANRLKDTLGDVRCIARLGANSFAILIDKQVDQGQCIKTAETIIASLSKPFQIVKNQCTIGVSIGIAGSWGGAKSSALLLQHADTAAGEAKKAGGNCWCAFDMNTYLGLQRYRWVERELHRAFDNGEFQAFYQPQIRLQDQKIVGVEALARWKHPEKGFISPEEFIAVSENDGRIEELGQWILEKACQDTMEWDENLTCSVNVSPIQFARSDLKSMVKKALIESGLPARRLQLEITESVLLGDNKNALKTMEELRSIGIKFALDDFGTGYSSLGYLSKMPIDKIKIDRRFVSNITPDSPSAAIVRSVQTLAEGLGMETVAEGMETFEEADLIRKIGCQIGQGYYFGKPMSARDLGEYVKEAAA